MEVTDIAARNAPPERTRFKLDGRSATLDSRIHAMRGDLADVSLAGILFSAHYARAIELTCVVAGTPVLSNPHAAATATSELLRGESFHALDVTTQWVWGFCGHDGYVGYVRRDALDKKEMPRWRVTARSAPVFSAADIKASIVDHWPAGAAFDGRAEGDFVACDEGFVHTRHLRPDVEHDRDWVAVAHDYLGQPYVWGGRGHHGVDCSGLVQVTLARCGISAPRDTDMQREAIGEPVPQDAALARGDFIFFPGHVGMMVDDRRMLHANAFWMTTMIEPLADVIARLTPDHPQPVLARRRIRA